MSKLSERDALHEGRRIERQRCLDCINELAIRLNEKVNYKIMTPAEEHLVNLRMQIADGIFTMLRQAISLGLESTPRQAEAPIVRFPAPVDGKTPPEGQEPVPGSEAP